MRGFILALLAIALLGAAAELSPVGNGGSTTVSGNHRNFLAGGPPPAPTPTPSPTPTPLPNSPTALLAYGYFTTASCSGNCGKDPGSVAMQAMFWGGETQQSSLASNQGFTTDCPGRTVTPQWANASGSSCEFYAYDGYFHNICKQNGNSNDPAYYAWQYAIVNGNEEPFALHFNSSHGNGTGNIVSGNRFTGSGEGGVCSSDASSATGTDFLWTNPTDSVVNACLYNYLTGTGSPCSGYPSGPWLCVNNPSGCNGNEGVSEDFMWWNYEGNYYESAEYGNTELYANPSSQNTHGEPFSGLQGFANFYNSQCNAVCVPFVAKTPTGGDNFCQSTTKPAGVTYVGTHCYPTGFGSSNDMLDIHLGIDEFCNNISPNTNFRAFLLENPVDRTTGAGDNLIIQSLNTIYYAEANNLCPGVKFVPEEGTQSYYPQQLGFVWLAPSSDGTPDLIVPWRHVGNNTNVSDVVPYYVDYGLVPYGPEQATLPFSFGGNAPDYGSWCQSATGEQSPNGKVGDSGGVQPLVVWCPASGLPIFVIQYAHSYDVRGVDQGPVAAVVNTSGVAESLQASWFGASAPGKGDPASTYNSVISFAQCGVVVCAGAYIPSGYAGPLLSALNAINSACTNATYCLTGSGQAASAGINMAGTPVSFAGAQSNCTDGNTCVPAEGAIFLSSQGAAPSSTIYTFTGCPSSVQIFGTSGAADGILQQNISTAGVDTNSANLMSLWGTTTFSNQSDNSSLERVNCATNSTPTYTINTVSGGHNPVVYDNVPEGYTGSTTKVPWCASAGTGCTRSFYFEGSSLCQSNTNADCSSIDKHWIVLNTDAGWEIEGGGHGCNSNCTNGPNGFRSGTFSAYSGMKLNTLDSYTGNWGTSGAAMGNSNGDSGISYLTTVLWWPDMNDAINRSATVINHPLNLILPTSMSACFGTGCLSNSQRHTNVSPSSNGGDGALTCNTLSGCFIYGDLFRLKSSVSCGSDPQAIIVCNTLKTYGMYLTDTGSSAPVIRLGIAPDGTDGFDTGVITWIKGLSLNNFEVITRGQTTP